MRLGPVAAACGLSLLPACLGELVGLPAGATDAAVATSASGPSTDAGEATDAAPPSFVDVQQGLDDEGCPACHAVSQPPILRAHASTPADLDANYAQVVLVINRTAPAQSLLLQRPLGDNHPMLFGSPNDPVYQRWLAWITLGAPR